MKIERLPLRDASSSHTTSLNDDALSIIERRLKNVDSHLDISSGPLIKDQLLDRMVIPNFCLFILPLFEGLKHFWIFFSDQTF